jgi:hypothetical protein
MESQTVYIFILLAFICGLVLGVLLGKPNYPSHY